MSIDALAWEQQFVDHMAPVWHLLPDRGRFLVDPSLVEYAASRGIEAVPTPRPPHDVHYPPPRHDGPPALVASYGCTKEARRLGYGPFAYLEHGIGQSYGEVGPRDLSGSYSGGADRADTELFLVPGPDPASKWRAAYPGARVEVVGSPRLDDLPRRAPGPKPVVAISFHWPAPLSVSGYAGNALADYIGVLPELAKLNVIGHAHPKAEWPARMQRLYRRAGIPFVADFADVCRRADVYVCDNSSTIYEFAATGRPVVLLNARYWSRKGPELGLRFWAASHVGINVDRPADLFAAIDEALVDAPERQAAREDALSLVYGVRTGATAAAVAAITDWLASKGEVAA